MTKSELIAAVARKQTSLAHQDVETAINRIVEYLSEALSQGQRVEIRGFGGFSLTYRPARTGRNPKTGEAVPVAASYVPRFKPGKELRERVNNGQGRK